MPVRHAVVAGQFYPADPRELRAAIARYFEHPAPPAATFPSGEARPSANSIWTETSPLLTMLPHAGYMYCGPVIAATLAGVSLPRRLVILAPSHTGMGHPLGYWADGAWETPLGAVPVDAELGRELSELDGGFVPDVKPHVREHDIEVLLPFLQTVRPDLTILPIVVGRSGKMGEAAHALAGLIRRHVHDGQSDVAIILSSDMNHYADVADTRRLDALALEAFLALNPQKLARMVRQYDISMCGILPALLGLQAALELGADQARLVAYDTSGTASGENSRVVGYAGVKAW